MRTNPIFYCKRCNGEGGWMDFHEDCEIFFQCPDCNGTGLSQDKKEKHEIKKSRRSNTDSNEGDKSPSYGNKRST